MPREVMCQMGSCGEFVGEAGVSVTLRTKDRNDEQRAVFCCARHAALSMLALAKDRDEPQDTVNLVSDVPRSWKTA